MMMTKTTTMKRKESQRNRSIVLVRCRTQFDRVHIIIIIIINIHNNKGNNNKIINTAMRMAGQDTCLYYSSRELESTNIYRIVRVDVRHRPPTPPGYVYWTDKGKKKKQGD